MSTPQIIPFIGPMYELQGVSMAQRKAINMFLQSGEGQAKYSQLLIGTPGTKVINELQTIVGNDNWGCRGLWMTDNGPFTGGTLYSVFGSKLCKTTQDPLTGNLITTIVFDIGLDTTRVSMTDNGGYLCLVNGQEMWLVDIFTDVVTNLTTSLPFTLPKTVVYLGGRFVCITNDPAPTTKKELGVVLKNQLLWWSELGIEGAKTWDALSFASAEASADSINALVVRQGDIWAFGSRSYQVFATTANPDSPIQYAGGSSTNIGVNAPYSAFTIGETVFWLGSNASGRNVVFQASGYNSIRVSNHGIESILQEFGDLTTQAYGFAYQEAGHLYYILTIPPGQYEKEGVKLFTDGRTLVYDSTTQQWHERASREPITGKLQAWQPLFSAYGFGKIIVGNLLWPVLMELKQDVYTDYDPYTPTKTKPIFREYQGGVMFDNLQQFILDEFQADFVVGHGPLNGLSNDPKASLAISYDSGNTWGNFQQCPMQKTGNYAGRVRWLKLGSARNFVLKIQVTEDMFFMLGEGRSRTRVSTNP
jgi:hypothetical protein